MKVIRRFKRSRGEHRCLSFETYVPSPPEHVEGEVDQRLRSPAAVLGERDRVRGTVPAGSPASTNEAPLVFAFWEEDFKLTLRVLPRAPDPSGVDRHFGGGQPVGGGVAKQRHGRAAACCGFRHRAAVAERLGGHIGPGGQATCRVGRSASRPAPNQPLFAMDPIRSRCTLESGAVAGNRVDSPTPSRRLVGCWTRVSSTCLCPNCDSLVPTKSRERFWSRRRPTLSC